MNYTTLNEPPLGSFIQIINNESKQFGFLVSVQNEYYLLKNKNKFWKHRFQPEVNKYTYSIPETKHKKKMKQIAKELNIVLPESTVQTFNELYEETETILNNFDKKPTKVF